MESVQGPAGARSTASSPCWGWVKAHNIEFQGRHGVSAAEQQLLRRFQVDIAVRYDLRKAMESDHLQDTVDTAALVELVVRMGTQHTFALMERLMGAVLEEIHVRWPGCLVKLELRKLHPPCSGFVDHTAICINELEQG